MKVQELVNNYGFRALAMPHPTEQLTNLYYCDLLSWVMAKGTQGTAWVTVMTHNNILAVASLLEFSCIIIPESIEVDKDVLEKAIREGVNILTTDFDTFGIFKTLYEAGIES